MGVGSRYSDELKISALAHYDLDGRIRTTAKQFNIPPSTLTDWINARKEGTLAVPDADNRIELSKSYFIDQSKEIMGQALTVVKQKLNAASAAQAATIYAILFDKVALMEGKQLESGSGSTTNNIIINMSDDEKAALLGKAFGRMANKDVIEAENCVVSDENNDGDIYGLPDF